MEAAARVSTLSSVASNALQSFLAEPAIADPPSRVWRDWVLAAAILIGSVLEAVFRTDVPRTGLALIVSALVAASVMWRRTHRLPAMIVSFGSIAVLSIVVRVVDGGVAGYYSMAFVLLVPYALFRWGSGREAAWGVPLLLMMWIVGITTDPGTLGEAVGGLIVVLAAPVIGIEVRQLRASRLRKIDQARVAERELLARELHDTVAHHVSAIAIQAQAGRAVAATDPGAAVQALAVIEDAASRTLAEMRTMVAALRHDGDRAETAPPRGVADIHRLGGLSGLGPLVDVRLTGDLRDLPPSLDAALYRIAQESITNASRHAVGATRIDVRVVGEPDGVRLTVSDDGRSTTVLGGAGDGFGLVGMSERVKLLGGSVTAGRAGSRGWVVDAALPRDRARS
jgi:signal transduction histidine kinase